MAQAIFRQEGDSIDHTPVGAIAVGEVVVQGSLVGIAHAAIAASALGSLRIEGIFDFLFATGEAATVGQDIFWDETNDLATIGAATVYLGKCVKAAAADDDTVRVKLVLVEGAEGTATASV